MKSSKSDLHFFPTETILTQKVHDWTALHGEKFILISNATQTVYLTRNTPIEFVLVDASLKRRFTIITVDPTLVSEKRTDHPAYYFLLPLTVPVDIATSPFQAIYFGWEYFVITGLGNTP